MATNHRPKAALSGARAAEPAAPSELAGDEPALAEAFSLADEHALAAPERGRRVWPLLLLLATLASGGVGAYQWWRTRAEKPRITRASCVAQRADLPIIIRDTGSLDALQSEIIKSKVEGQNTIISLVPEGTIITEDDVKSGKTLVELDSADLREKLSQQEVTFATAEATYKQAKELFDIEKSAGESKVKQGELDVKFGRMDLEAYVGQALAADALAERVDLGRLAVQLCEDAVSHRRQVEAELATSLTEVNRALKGDDEGADKAPEGAQGAAPPKPPEDPEPAGSGQPATPAQLLGGAALQKMRKLEADIGLAFEEFKRAADKVASYAGLKRLGIKSSQQLEAEQLALLRAQIALDQALTARELYLRYDFPKEAEKLLSGYSETQRELDRIKARARSALAAAEAEVKSAEAKFVLQRDRLAKLTTQLENCTMRATKPGLVVYATSGGGWHWRGNPIDVGTSVRELQEIIKMPDLSSLAVSIRVHESVVDKVKPDQPARIRVDAFPTRKFTGKVIKVAVLPNTSSSWLNPDLKEYDTQVSIEGDLAGLKPGMSANVEVDVKTLKNVLQVPVQAVGTRRGRTVVYVLGNDGSEEMREVATGEANEQVVEILSGLREGERVLLEAPQTAPSEEEATPDEDQEKKGDEEPAPDGVGPPGVRPPAEPGAPSDPREGRPDGKPGRPPRGDKGRPRPPGGSRDSSSPSKPRSPD